MEEKSGDLPGIALAVLRGSALQWKLNLSVSKSGAEQKSNAIASCTLLQSCLEDQGAEERVPLAWWTARRRLDLRANTKNVAAKKKRVEESVM